MDWGVASEGREDIRSDEQNHGPHALFDAFWQHLFFPDSEQTGTSQPEKSRETPRC
jgi:predicted lipoprotein